MKKFYRIMFLALVVVGYTNSFAQEAQSGAQENNSWVKHLQFPDGNVYEAERAFNKYWEGKDLTAPRATKGKGYKVFYRWRNFVEPRVYPSGNKVSPAIAIKEFEDFRAAYPPEYSKNSANARSTIGNWTLVGPTNPGGSVANGSYQSPGGSGRINAIAVDPNNSNTYWVGTPAGGLWKSTDAGLNWTSMTDDLPVIGVSSIVIDPTNSNVMYIGTGDRDAGDTYSVGVLKSTDGGATWNNTAMTYTVSDKKRVSKIVMSADDNNTLVIACTDGIYKSTDGLATVSTVASGTYYFDIEYHPTNSSILYAAGTSFYKSTNGGDSFSEVTSGLNSASTYRYEIAVSPAAANSVWVVAANNTDYGLQGFYKSTNSGGSFSSVYSGGNLLGWSTAHNDSGGQGWYDLTLTVNPSNANEIFMGGVNLQKSTNGGTSWSTNGYWLDGSSYEYVHADHHFTMYLNSTTVLSGNDGGFFKTTNNGSTWTDFSNNLSIAQIAGMGNSATNGNLIMAGMQDNGTNQYNGTSWSIVRGGDGGETMIEPGNDNNMYQSFVNGDITRSTNGGSSWSDMRPSSASGGAWVTPMVVHPSTFSTIFAGYNHLWRSTNRGVSWTKTGNTSGSGNIINIAIAPSDANYIYIIKQNRTQSGTTYYIQRSTNGGSSWTTIESGTPIASAAPTYFAVSETNPSQVYLTFSGYTAGEKVYTSTNAGSTWTNISGNLPNIPSNTIVYENGSNNALYVGTDVGVYYRSDDTANWELFSEGLPNVIIRELEIYYDAVDDNSRLRAGTYGRSLWESPLKSGVPVACTATVPTGLAATAITTNGATLGWDAVAGATYDLRYRVVGTTTWTTNAVSSNSSSLSGLTALTNYEAQVRSKCADASTSAYSASVNFSTPEVQLNYCASNGQDTSDEYIGRVQLGSIDNSSGAGAGGYADHTSLTTNLTTNASTTITITPTWTGTIYDEGYSVWIDYNKDGDFADAGEQVWSQAKSKTTPVSGSFTIPATATTGNTRMRVSMSYNAVPTSCQSFSYGEVEDYTVNIISATPDTTVPVITLVGNAIVNLNVGDTYNEQGATATDNIDGNLTSSIVTTGTVNTASAGTYTVNYNVSDAAGNAATQVSRTVIVSAVIDTTAPVITLIGDATINLNVGDTYSEQGATATDNIDGNLTSSIVISGTVNMAVDGVYSVNYNVSDAAGNAAIQVTRTVIVNADTTAPVITLVGSASININVGDVYTEQGATATDNLDGDLTSSIVISGSVNTAVAGNYTVNYNVSDASGNAATQVTRSVTVNEVPIGCSGGVSSFPYNEGFESGLGAWTQAAGDDLDWTRDASGTPSSSTGPSSATEGSYYMYVEASSPNYPSKTTIFNSPCVDLSAETGATFSFSYHMYGASMGSLTLEASTDGNNWSALWTRSGDQGNAWSTANADLAAYAGGTVQLRFVGVTGDGYRSDIAIDKISITTGETGGCADVTLTLVVDDYPEETSWTITDGGGATVASGGLYSSTPDRSTVIETECLADGCYTFTINDVYGDGICCNYGNGSYSLTDGSGTVLASGGSFTSSQATNFCLTAGAGVASSAPAARPGFESDNFLTTTSLLYPNPVSNYLNITVPKGMESMSVYATNGVEVTNVSIYNNGIDVSQLKTGVYMVIIKTEKGIIHEKFVKE